MRITTKIIQNNSLNNINNYAHIVGNGTSDTARSNAHTLDWQGNAWFAGDVYIGGTSMDDPNAKKLGAGGEPTLLGEITFSTSNIDDGMTTNILLIMEKL